MSKSINTVVVVVDGLRHDLLSSELTPNIMRIASDGVIYANYRSIFPSATRITAATFATGCMPINHGLYGNTMALMDNGVLRYRSAFDFEFLEWMRSAFGRTLARKTLSQRFVEYGGAVVFSNMPAGDALFMDPDGYGHMYSLTKSRGPGCSSVNNPLHTTQDVIGDKSMVDRFCGEVISNKSYAYSLIWLCEPDTYQHNNQLGSPGHLETIVESDKRVGEIRDAIDNANQDTLLIVCSDHGQETVWKRVNAVQLLIDSGIKKSLESDDVVVCSNGPALMIYSKCDSTSIGCAICSIFQGQDWVDGVYSGKDLALLGYREDNYLCAIVNLAHTDEPNQYGVKGKAVIAHIDEKNKHHLNVERFSTHGGLGEYETHPFMVIRGRGFPRGCSSDAMVLPTDVAPTVLKHHGISHEQLDGSPLQYRQEPRRRINQ